MASSLPYFFEQYLNGLDYLTPEIRRNFLLLHDLDVKSQQVASVLYKLEKDYMQKLKVPGRKEEKEKLMRDIKAVFSKAKEYSDDKVQLSVQTYELVDKQIRRLDEDLSKYEGKAPETELKISDVIAGVAAAKKRGKGRGKAATTSVKNVPSAMFAPVVKRPMVQMEMPIDPNEPTYCICESVSYGDMICCDNPECPIEWFHFPCVNVVVKPKGKWYCPQCTYRRKKK